MTLTVKELIYDPWSPLSSLRRALRRTVSWQKALEWAVPRRDPDAAVDLITRVGLEPKDQAAFLARCDDAVRQHLGKALDQYGLAPRIRFRGTTVVEWNEGWYNDRTGQRISDSVRVTDVLYPKEGGAVLQGHVGSGKNKPFQVASLDVRREGLLTCLKKHFDTQGIPFDFLPGWSASSDYLASKFHKPQAIGYADLVGWSDYRLCLPQFAIGFGGHIKVDQGTMLIRPDTPAQGLAPPIPLQRADVRPLAFDTPTNNLFWAVIVAVVYHVMAPACLAKPIGIVLAGEGANSLAEAIAAVFGCRAVPFSPKRQTGAAFDRLNSQVSYPLWPAIVMAESESLPRAERILAKLTLNTFLTVPAAAEATARTKGWHLLQADNSGEAIELLQRFGAQVALNYLQDLLRRHLGMNYHRDGWFRAIWVDLASWFSDIARGRQAVLGAHRCLVPPPSEWASHARITNVEDED